MLWTLNKIYCFLPFRKPNADFSHPKRAVAWRTRLCHNLHHSSTIKQKKKKKSKCSDEERNLLVKYASVQKSQWTFRVYWLRFFILGKGCFSTHWVSKRACATSKPEILHLIKTEVKLIYCKIKSLIFWNIILFFLVWLCISIKHPLNHAPVAKQILSKKGSKNIAIKCLLQLLLASTLQIIFYRCSSFMVVKRGRAFTQHEDSRFIFIEYKWKTVQQHSRVVKVD